MDARTLEICAVMARLQYPQSGGGKGVKTARQRPIHALLSGCLRSQQSGCPRTETCARDRKAGLPSAPGWEITPWPQPREPAPTAAEVPRYDLSMQLGKETGLLKGSQRKKNKTQPTKSSLKTGESPSRN